MQAELKLEYDDPRVARAVADAISPDNFKTPAGLSIKTTIEARKVVTNINSRAKFSTFIATIDDLLFCASTAEKTLQTIREFRRR